MNTFQVGDLVRWVVDVDKVYSKDTKKVVGTVGTVLPPREYYRSSEPNAEKYLTPEGFYDVEFYLETRPLVVGQIPEIELVKVMSSESDL